MIKNLLFAWLLLFSVTAHAQNHPGAANFGMTCPGSGYLCVVPKYDLVTVGSSYTLKPDWNPTQNAIIAVGEGANGGAGNGSNFGAPGGHGGAISEILNLSDAAGTVETITIGTGGSGVDTTFKSSAVLKAQSGTNGGLSSGSVGTIKHSGGAGGNPGHFSGSGGGSAGSLVSDGVAGATATGATNPGGKGGSFGNTGGLGGLNTLGLQAGQAGLFYPIYGNFFGAGDGGGGGGQVANNSFGLGGNGGPCGGAAGGGSYNGSLGGTGGYGCILVMWWPE